MILAAVALHLVLWQPRDVQIGIGAGKGVDERLVALIPKGGCSAGVKFYADRYGDVESAAKYIAHSKVCEVVDERRAGAASSGPSPGP